ncbi:DDE superfamily endonuclease [Arenibacter nanhaiticus]|uniref:DDE superfamily endonuclease n=1 Tax=Arenibacter nanhaiticus TaxID=558155 RepID=A0A1M6A584_9FLAO|nr:transposase [Arenibacter nanhaiticus]SHI31597.1 DDE superfamily endonuclease [Arenibacter nanhaiticus]
MPHVGTALTAKGVKPIVNYQQAFKNTYLYGSYSPMDGSHFTWEVEGVDTLIFEAYRKEFSLYRPEELKIVVIDNPGFHSTKNINIPDNIKPIRIPPYTPELNPFGKVWQYLKTKRLET